MGAVLAPHDVAAKRCLAGAVELACRKRVDRVLTRKQPTLRPTDLPPSAQQFEQLRREHYVAILATLALLDAQHHARAVDVGDLERHQFRGPQARAVSDTEGAMVF